MARAPEIEGRKPPSTLGELRDMLRPYQPRAEAQPAKQPSTTRVSGTAASERDRLSTRTQPVDLKPSVFPPAVAGLKTAVPRSASQTPVDNNERPEGTPIAGAHPVESPKLPVADSPELPTPEEAPRVMTIHDGHHVDGKRHDGVPCNWQTYYGRDAVGRSGQSRVALGLGGVDNTDFTTGAGALFEAMTARSSRRELKKELAALEQVSVHSDRDIARVAVERVTSNGDLDAESGVRALGSARPFTAALRTLHRVEKKRLERERKEATWSLVDKTLYAATGFSGVATAYIAAAGTVGGILPLLALAFGIFTAISRGLRAAWENSPNYSILSRADERDLERLQQSVAKEFMDHNSSEHEVMLLQSRDGKTRSLSEWVAEILQPRRRRDGYEWFGAAHDFHEFGYRQAVGLDER